MKCDFSAEMCDFVSGCKITTTTGQYSEMPTPPYYETVTWINKRGPLKVSKGIKFVHQWC